MNVCMYVSMCLSYVGMYLSICHIDALLDRALMTNLTRKTRGRDWRGRIIEGERFERKIGRGRV